MSGSTFGKNFRITTWGESHGVALGVTIDGCPSGLPLSEEDINVYMARRKPGGAYATKRKEDDEIKILSGVFEGKTTGTPISMIVYNADHHSADYSNIASCYRPGHADYTFDAKYGFRDYRGGGRSSGRETLSRVAGGAVALLILKELGISVSAHASEIAGIKVTDNNSEEINARLDEIIKNLDSAGGVVECAVKGLPAGIGETVFDKLDANLAKAMLSIGAVKGFEIGEGFNAAKLLGSENNDGFEMKDGNVVKTSNHSGGVLGGMSDGSDLVFRLAFKPTPSIAQTQKTVNKDNENIDLVIHGRHDPLVVNRAIVVVEAMAAVTIVDLLFENMHAKLDNVKKFYN